MTFTDATDLPSAIENFRLMAVAAFNSAVDNTQAAQPTTPAQNQTEAQTQAAWAAGVAQAKSQMASALQQLIQADTMNTEFAGRQALAKVYGAISNLAASTLIAADSQAELAGVSEVLQALATTVGKLPSGSTSG